MSQNATCLIVSGNVKHWVILYCNKHALQYFIRVNYTLCQFSIITFVVWLTKNLIDILYIKYSTKHIAANLCWNKDFLIVSVQFITNTLIACICDLTFRDTRYSKSHNNSMALVGGVVERLGLNCCLVLNLLNLKIFIE